MPWGAPFSVYYSINIEKIMKIDDLFDQHSMIAAKLKNYIRERGFTKASLARKAGISRPMLEKFLDGNIDNQRVFDKCLCCALVALSISADDLIRFEPKVKPKTVDTICLKSVPKDYRMSAKAQKQYGLLMDILELCEIYY